jgi:hypothetical protein
MPTFDTHIQLLPASNQTLQTGTYTYGFSKHIGIKGFQRLITHYMKALLTLEGTDLSDRDYGTRFPALIGSNVTATADIQEIVTSAAAKAESTVIARQAKNPDLTADERLASAVVTSIIFDPDGLGFDATIYLKNKAGVGLQFLLPTSTHGGA